MREVTRDKREGGKVSKARTPPFVTKKYCYGAQVCMNDMRAKILGCWCCFPRSKKVS